MARIIEALCGSEARRLPQQLAVFRASLPPRHHRFRRAQARCRAEPSASGTADRRGPEPAGARHSARALRARRRVASARREARRSSRGAGNVGRQPARYWRLFLPVRLQHGDARQGFKRVSSMSAMGDALSLLTLPFAAAVAFVLIHAYLGVHVLRRRVVFADLALAQLSALGATVAFANGYAPASPAGFGYALLFTAIGALLLTLIRVFARLVSQEALIGILYVVATAATILVIDRSPQGAEHVKKILIGSILTVDGADLAKLAALYAAIGALHWLWRRPLLAVSSETPPAGRSQLGVSVWDFLF